MKKLALVIATLSSFSASALEYGQCVARAQSKKYVEGNFHLPYPKNVSFTCAYNCKGDNGVETVVGLSKIRVANMREDGTRVVCQGVKVTFTGVYFRYDGSKSFYAHATRIPEIKRWATKHVSRDNPLELEKLSELRKQLEQVGSSYIYVGANPNFIYFRKAGELLLDIAATLPSDTSKLDRAIKDFVKSGKSYGATTKEHLIQSVLKSSASFRYN